MEWDWGELVGLAELPRGIPHKVRREACLQALKGIPSHLRRLIWPALCNARGVRDRGSAEWIASASWTPSPPPKQPTKRKGKGFSADIALERKIGRDVPRTYPSSTVLSQIMLFRVLRAVAFSDRSVGYVQGMNSIAARLILALDCAEREEERRKSIESTQDAGKARLPQFLGPGFASGKGRAPVSVESTSGRNSPAMLGSGTRRDGGELAYWVMLSVLRVPGVRGLFSDGLPSFAPLMKALDLAMKENAPRLYERLVQSGVTGAMYAAGWVITLMTHESIPDSLSLRVWDLFLAGGCDIMVIFRSIVSMMLMGKEDLLRVVEVDDDGIQLMDVLRNLPQSVGEQSEEVVRKASQLRLSKSVCDIVERVRVGHRE